MFTVVLGVSGSVAAYRAADVARELMRHGCKVRVCLTRAAQEFVTPQLFEALTGNPCLTHAFDEPVAGEMAHILWAREANVVLVCPATANILASLAHGVADDMLTTIVSATNAALVIAPAMNPTMFASEEVQLNLETLQRKGAQVVMPATGDVACGEHGQGKLASIEAITEACLEAVAVSSLYKGKRVLVTAGPTREPIDPVRYLSNRSSGKMGFALARALKQMGATVTLVAGPTTLIPPAVDELVRVETAEEMATRSAERAKEMDLAICVAAVADYKVQEFSKEKLKKQDSISLELVKTVDVIEAITNANPKLPVIGFAAETEDHQKNASKKLTNKKLFAICLNNVERADIGFSSDDNELEIHFSDGEVVQVSKRSKFNAAVELLTQLFSKLLPFLEE